MPDPDLKTILAPLTHIISFQQLETLLYAYLPPRLEQYIERTGIYSVDAFLVNALVTILLILTRLVVYAGQGLIYQRQPVQAGLILLVDSVIKDDYRSSSNVYHQALSKVISQLSQDKKQGRYELKTGIQGKLDLPPIQIVPQAHQETKVVYEGMEIKIEFMDSLSIPPPAQTMMHGGPPPRESEPSIRLTTTDPLASVEKLSRYLTHVAKGYQTELEKQDRARYEYTGGKWVRRNGLLETVVVLDKTIEDRVWCDVDEFINSQDYYDKLGLRFRRGYLLYGTPGTGKTSLVLALAARLSRSLYYINLGVFTTDEELLAAFTSLPAHAIVVFEDIDTQSAIVLRRKPQDLKGPSLGTLLSILDGHCLATGILFIITTNHKEWLDPALIRQGRMDLEIELTRTTRYQLERMYQITQPDDATPLSVLFPNLSFPPHLVPPCQVMQIMVRYRHDTPAIPAELEQLVASNKVD